MDTPQLEARAAAALREGGGEGEAAEAEGEAEGEAGAAAPFAMAELGGLSFRSVSGDVRVLHRDAANAGAVFQVRREPVRAESGRRVGGRAAVGGIPSREVRGTVAASTRPAAGVRGFPGAHRCAAGERAASVAQKLEC